VITGKMLASNRYSAPTLAPKCQVHDLPALLLFEILQFVTGDPRGDRIRHLFRRILTLQRVLPDHLGGHHVY
jgi:hypothetical protein